MEEYLLQLRSYLPVEYNDKDNEKYIEYLNDAFLASVAAKTYQFAFIAFHMLFMSYIYKTIWLLRKENYEGVEVLLNQIARDIQVVSSPFDFSVIDETKSFQILKCLRLHANELEAFTLPIKIRNHCSHASGYIQYEQDKIERYISDELQSSEKILQRTKSCLALLFKNFLCENWDPETREFISSKDTVTSFIKLNLLSPKEIEILTTVDIPELQELSNSRKNIYIKTLYLIFLSLAQQYIDTEENLLMKNLPLLMHGFNEQSEISLETLINDHFSDIDFKVMGESTVKTTEDIIKELNNEPSQYASVSKKGFLFQKFVHDLLQKSGYRVEPEQGRQNIRVDFLAYVPATSPNGSTREQMWVVETKYRNLQRSIGLDVLNQLSAYVDIFKANKGLLVTISTLTGAAKQFLASNRHLEVWDADKLVDFIKQFPELRKEYPDIASQLENPTEVETLIESTQNEQHELIKELRAMPTGNGKAYEELVKRILEFCFHDEFRPFAVKEQVYSHNKKRIRDFIIDNRSPKVEFWRRLIWVRKVEKILFDAKNYKDPVEYRDMLETLRYLKNDAFGNFIIIISRRGIKDYEEVVEDFSDKGQIALFLSDEDLVKMITLKLEGTSPTDLIEDKYFDFLDKK